MLIAAAVPSGVTATAEAFADPVDAQLLGDEADAVRRAASRRRAEFTTGRHCARTALRALGQPAGAIPRGERGEPRWPRGVVGSITHCSGYRASAVAHADVLATIGIDAEVALPLPERVVATIASPAERTMLAELADSRPDVAWDRLLFSAKESVYKAWFPLAWRWLGFGDADVTIAGDGTLAARILVPGPVARLSGRWVLGDGLIVTAVALRCASARSDAGARAG
ncbi:MAG TPA: 4'-phosphopantetheinyl transferase superfamily protein [Baekduia sp.]